MGEVGPAVPLPGRPLPPAETERQVVPEPRRKRPDLVVGAGRFVPTTQRVQRQLDIEERLGTVPHRPDLLLQCRRPQPALGRLVVAGDAPVGCCLRPLRPSDDMGISE